MISRSYWRSEAATSTYVSAVRASELPTKIAAYQRARRKPSVCRRRSRHFEYITHAPYGLDHLVIEVAINLLPQAVDEDVDHIGARVEAVVPDVGQDHRLRDDPPRVAHQILEQRELAGAQLDLASAAHGTTRVQVEREVTDGEIRRSGDRRCPANQRLDAGEQFSEGERFNQVVITAGLEPGDAVVHGAAGAQDQDGSSNLTTTELFDQRQAVELGKHDVDDRDVVGRRGRQLQSVRSVGGAVHRKTTLAQPARDEVGDDLVVLDEQGPHCSTIPTPNCAGSSRRTGKHVPR